MAQVKKLQQGGTTAPAKYKFSIDGADYEKDEQFLKDQFEPMFSELVKSGNAKERDKDLWRNSFQQYLGQARTGTYNIQSSSGAPLNISYTGDQGAELGLNEDGTTARKTQVGEVISRRSKNDAQRMAMLNNVLGTRLIGARDADKKKAEEDAAKLAGDEKKAVLDRVSGFRNGYGTLAYGKEWADNPTFVLDKYWDKKTTDLQRKDLLDKYAREKYQMLFDPTLDKYKDDIKASGLDLDAVRKQAGQYWDSATGNYKGAAPKYLKDFSRHANIWDTMISDDPFLSMEAYKKLKGGDAATATSTGGSTTGTGTKPLKQQGNTWLGDGGRRFADKEGKKLLEGIVDGTLYHKGEIFNGAYIGNDSSGNQDYFANTSGFYKQGKPVTKEAYENWYRELEKDSNTLSLRKLMDQRRQYVTDYYTGKLPGKGGFGNTRDDSGYQRKDSIYDTNASDYLLGGYKGGFSAAKNLSSQYGNDIGVALLRDDKRFDKFGNPFVENLVRLPDGRTFQGAIRRDAASGKDRLYGWDGKEIEEVREALSKARMNRNAKVDQHFRWGWDSKAGKAVKTDKPQKQLTYSPILGWYREGGIAKFVDGGLAKSNPSTPTRKQVSVKEIGKAWGNDNYQLSTADKWELGALGGDLAGLALSFTGAGSTLAAGVGVGSTLTQFGVDIARDGLDWGDAGRLAGGLALDAATIVPGLGIGAKATKISKVLAKSGKILVPMLTAAGFANAAGIVTDVMSGKKKLSDLSVDDLRGLANGIHASVGGARMAGQRLATKKGSQDFIMVNGKPKNITLAERTAIDGAEDKVGTAKKILSEKYGLKEGEIELSRSKSLNPKFWQGLTKTNEVAKTGSTSTGRQIKDVADYQGDGMWNSYMRGAINRAKLRDPKLNNGVDDRFGLLGDYFRKPTNITPPKPELLGLPPASGKPDMGVFPDRIAQNSVAKEVSDITDPNKLIYNRDRNRLLNRMERVRSFKKPAGQQSAKRETPKEDGFDDFNWFASFKDGGIIKAQGGVKVPFLPEPFISPLAPNTRNPFDQFLGKLNMQRDGILTPRVSPSIGVTAPSAKRLASFFDAKGNIVTDNTRVYGNAKPIDAGNQEPGAARKGLGDTLLGFTKNIDPLKASELARALFVRNVNSKVDTRVEAPMMDNPTEVNVPVRGNLLGSQALNQQANNLVANANNVKTSDGMLHNIMALDANSRAAGLRAQGDMVNVESIERTRGASMENDMRNAQIRNQIANQNKQTLARATQAERGAENAKLASMNQPIVDYWKDSNYKDAVQRERDRGIDMQIALQGKQSGYINAVSPLMSKLDANQMRLEQAGISEADRNRLVQENTLINKQQQWLQQQSILDQLRTRKDLNYITPQDWYTKGLPTMKEGGAVKVAIQNQKEAGNNERAAIKAHGSMIKDGVQDATKRQLAAMKEVQDLIKLALS